MNYDVVTAINTAIENGNEIALIMETKGFNAVQMHFMPECVDVNKDVMVVYGGHNLVTVDVSKIEWDQVDETFICISKESTVWIKTA